MPQIIEKQSEGLDAIVARGTDLASNGYGSDEQGEISKLLAFMHQASKTQYIIHTIPACNSDD